jgi:hypothetical protein
MQLQPTEIAWAPAEQPEYLTYYLLAQGPPRSAEELLALQVGMLQRLRREASEKELEQANRQLDNDLPQEALNFLPGKLLEDPKAPAYLLNNPAAEGGPLHQWKAGLKEAVKARQLMPQPEAAQLLAEESLESFLARVL